MSMGGVLGGNKTLSNGTYLPCTMQCCKWRGRGEMHEIDAADEV